MKNELFYKNIQETLDKQLGENFGNISAELAQEVSNPKYFLDPKLSRDEQSKRLSVVGAKDFLRARSNLSNLFEYIQSYESYFRNYNQILNQSLFRNPKLSKSRLISKSLNIFNRPLYEGFLRNAESYGTRISELPKKLNYLEHLN